MAAISYFEKISEDDERVIYHYGTTDGEWEGSVAVLKRNLHVADDTGEVTYHARLAARGAIRSFGRGGWWPERGAGVT